MTGGATSEETAETTPRGNARPSAAGGWRAVLPGLLVAFIPPLTGCANNAFDHLAPLLKVQDGTPMDSSGRYLVDFGSVAVGLSAVQP